MSSWTSIHRALVTGVALALCAPLAACKTPLERAWGVSQHAHVAQMIDDPEAGMHARLRGFMQHSEHAALDHITALRVNEIGVDPDTLLPFKSDRPEDPN